MITRRDLDEQIEYITGKINQSPEDCVRLAAYYTIRDHLDGMEIPQAYGAAPPVQADVVEETIGAHGETEFLRAITGQNADAVWAVIDETMSTLKLMEPRLYAGVLRKLQL